LTQDGESPARGSGEEEVDWKVIWSLKRNEKITVTGMGIVAEIEDEFEVVKWAKADLFFLDSASWFWDE
jgi:preprotein translocase subunit YajC